MNNHEVWHNENKRISNFIKEWRLLNELKEPKNLSDHNSKFKIDFNLFLENGSFSEQTVKLFKVN